MSTLNYNDIEHAVAAFADFTGNSLSGSRYIGTRGSLPTEWAELLATNPARVKYVVHSYSTPIGWVLDDLTVVIPDVKYSRTTSRGQNLLRRVWGHRTIVSTLDSKAA